MTRAAFLHKGRYITPTLATRPSLGERMRTALCWLVLWFLLCVLAWLVMPAAEPEPAIAARCVR